MLLATSTPSPIPPPLPADLDLRNLHRVWSSAALYDQGWFLKLERFHPECIAPLLRLMRARWQSQGGGFEPDPETMAHFANVDPDDWEARIYPAMRHLFQIADNGRLYLTPGLDDVQAAWDICRTNRSRTAPARAASKAASKARRDDAKTSRPKAKPNRELPDYCGESAQEGSVTPSSPVSFISLTPATEPQREEPVSAAAAPGGEAVGDACPAERQVPEPVERFLRLYPCLPRNSARREAVETEVRIVWPKLEADPEAILAGLRAQLTWLSRHRQPTEKKAPGPLSWLAHRRWEQNFTLPPQLQHQKVALNKAAGAAVVPHSPPRGAADSALMDWAEAKVRRSVEDRGITAQDAVGRVTAPGWWGTNYPEGPAMLLDLRDALLARLALPVPTLSLNGRRS